MNKAEEIKYIVSELSKAHDLLAKSSIKQDQYAPISQILAETKLKLIGISNNQSASATHPKEGSAWVWVDGKESFGYKSGVFTEDEGEMEIVVHKIKNASSTCEAIMHLGNAFYQFNDKKEFTKEHLFKAYNFFRYRGFPHGDTGNTMKLEFEDFLETLGNESQSSASPTADGIEGGNTVCQNCMCYNKKENNEFTICWNCGNTYYTLPPAPPKNP